MRNICFYTGTRAEYGLLKPLMKQVQAANDLNLQIIASGSHLSPEFGMTYKEILDDGFCIDEKIEIILSSDTQVSICKSIGLGMISYGEAIDRLKPDCIVILGDRYEAFAMAATATVCNAPIIHIHGGEVTIGAIDEAFRHSITKMSQLHFTSTEVYRKRVIQLGENPDRVFNVGALGIENIRKLKLSKKEMINEKFNLNEGQGYFLITFHPVTIGNISSKKSMNILLKSLSKFPEFKLIFTKSNSDTDGRVINNLIDDYVSENKDRSMVFDSLGQVGYLSAMKHSKIVIGNSSSGIIEAPSFKIPTVDIGFRQKGRVKASSIIESDVDLDSISESISRALSEEFQNMLSNVNNPYEQENTSLRIIDEIRRINFKNILLKPFFDINFR